MSITTVNTIEVDDSQPHRVAIRVFINDLPCEPLRRALFVSNLFAEKVLHRKLNQEAQPPVFDHVRIPDGFVEKSDNPIRRWLILDLNVSRPIYKEEMETVPVTVFQMREDDGEWNFYPRPEFIDYAKSRSSDYKWGGLWPKEGWPTFGLPPLTKIAAPLPAPST